MSQVASVATTARVSWGDWGHECDNDGGDTGHNSVLTVTKMLGVFTMAAAASAVPVLVKVLVVSIATGVAWVMTLMVLYQQHFRQQQVKL